MFLSLIIIATVIGLILVVISSLSTPNSFLDRSSNKMNTLLFLYGMDQTSFTKWIATFAQWCYSQSFKNAWEPFKTTYDEKSRKFIDLIFSKSVNNNQIKNPIDLEQLAKEIVNSNEMQAILLM